MTQRLFHVKFFTFLLKSNSLHCKKKSFLNMSNKAVASSNESKYGNNFACSTVFSLLLLLLVEKWQIYSRFEISCLALYPSSIKILFEGWKTARIHTRLFVDMYQNAECINQNWLASAKGLCQQIIFASSIKVNIYSPHRMARRTNLWLCTFSTNPFFSLFLFLKDVRKKRSWQCENFTSDNCLHTEYHLCIHQNVARLFSLYNIPFFFCS